MKWKNNMVFRVWERCRGGGDGGKKSSSGTGTSCHELKNRKSWNCTTTRSVIAPMEESDHKGKNNNKCQVAPEGCFSVYVGPQRQRFVIKTEFANHPLFRLLLEDAELEYGFNSQGPLLLPCDVDLFNKVLAEMDDNGDEEITSVCSFACSSPLIFCSPSRLQRQSSSINKEYGSYKLLTPSRLLKKNSY